MNVYYIDPTNIKSEAWNPLLTYLKVNGVYSFIPENELPEILVSIIKPHIKAAYSHSDKKRYADNCVFWLRAHFEKHIHLITDDYVDRKSVPEEELKNYGSRSAYKNINNLNVNNCLILLKLKTTFNNTGGLVPPKCEVDYLDPNYDQSLPTYISNYCLNILHKKYKHNQYQKQSAFLIFDEFFFRSYLFDQRLHNKWSEYYCKTEDGISRKFVNVVYQMIHELSPVDFPKKEINGKQFFTLIRKDESTQSLQELLKEASRAEIEYEKEIEKEEKMESSGYEFDKEVKQMNEDFWRECGESGSNCESWPGWG